MPTYNLHGHCAFPPWLCLWNLEPEVYLYDKASGGGLLPKLSYNERLKQLDLLLLVYQREVKDLVTFHKLNCGHYNYSFDSYFQFCSDRWLRSFSSNNLRLNLVKTELFKGTFLNRIPYYWNNLPYNLRTEDLSLPCFKKCWRDFYKTKIRGFDLDRSHVTWAWDHSN